MRELDEVPFSSQYPLISSKFTMTYAIMYKSVGELKNPPKKEKNNYQSLYMSIKNNTLLKYETLEQNIYKLSFLGICES